MNEFKNWTEVTTNMYRYAVAAGASYEILVTYQADGTPVGTARANLYSVGYWSILGSGKFDFSRELIMSDQPVQHCVEKAIEDLKAFDSNLAEELVHGPVTFE